MLQTVCRLDKLAAIRSALAEHGMMDGTTASYTAMINAGGEPQPGSAIEDDDANENDDNGPALGPKALSTVELARIPGFFFSCHSDRTSYSCSLQREIIQVQ
jgi:hypothetical protein